MDPTGHFGPTTPGANPVRPSTPGTYSTYLGGYGDDAAFSLAVDSADQAYVVGVADSVNFPGTAEGTIPGFPKTVPTNRYIAHPACANCGSHLNGILPPYNPDFPPQSSDGFVVKLNAAGNGLLYSSYIGGSGDEVVHGIVHSTRAGSHGIYIAGLSTSQNTAPPPEGCPPGTDPCPPPPPNPWYAFPVTPDAYQPLHKVGRTVRCDGGPPTSEADDYPCPPLPANPSEDAFITRLNDNPDELPAPPVGLGGPTAPDFALQANPGSLSIPRAGPSADTGSFSVSTSSVGGFTAPVNLAASVNPASGLAVKPSSVTVTWGGTSYPATTFSLTASNAGTYTVTITGTSGTVTHSATVNVTVVNPDFSITVNPSSISFPQVGGSATVTVPVTAVGGLSQNVTITPAATSGLTFNPTSASASPGGFGSFIVTASTPGTRNVTITGSCTGCGLGGSNLAHTTTLSVNARPANFSLSASPNEVIVSGVGSSASTTVTITPIDNFSGSLTLTNSWTGSPPTGLSISPSSATRSGPPFATASFTVTSLPTVTPGTYKVTITGTGGSPSLTRTVTVTVIVPSNTGFRGPTANSAANSNGDGNGFEVSPTNAYADDGAFAVDNNSGASTGTSCTSQNKDSHRFWNYGFAVPGASTITGIEVRVDAKADSAVGTPMMCVQLSWNGGSTWTIAKSTSLLTTSEATYTLGAVSDNWGRTWTAANLSNASFRVRVIDISSSADRDFSLDWVAVRVNYR